MERSKLLVFLATKKDTSKIPEYNLRSTSNKSITKSDEDNRQFEDDDCSDKSSLEKDAEEKVTSISNEGTNEEDVYHFIEHSASTPNTIRLISQDILDGNEQVLTVGSYNNVEENTDTGLVPSTPKATYNYSNFFEIPIDEHNFVDFSDSGSEYVPLSLSSSDSTLTPDKPIQQFSMLENIFTEQDLIANDEQICPIPTAGTTNVSSPNESNILISNNENIIDRRNRKERPTICPFCFQTVVTHFPRHLIRHHEQKEEVIKLQSFKKGSNERMQLIGALRKQGYFHLNTTTNILNPTRTSQNPETEYIACYYCLGYFSKNLLFRHVKRCRSKPMDSSNEGRNCQGKSQTLMALINLKNDEFLKNSRLSKEIFTIMLPDQISFAAKGDNLICLYGETLLSKHKRTQIATTISNKMREAGRLLLNLRTLKPEVTGLFDAMKPEYYATLILATKNISGYDPVIKSFKAPSLAMHMGTNLKQICDVALRLVMEKKTFGNINWTDQDKKKTEIKDLKKLIEGHWSNDISSLALKDLNEKHWIKPNSLPLTSDILLFQSYLNETANSAFQKLQLRESVADNYKVLVECVFALTVMFNRKRVGDVQYLKIETYEKQESSVINQEAFEETLTAVEKVMSKRFKRILTGGKGSKPVPILFSPRLQKFIAELLVVRSDCNIVPDTNTYLFANIGSAEKWLPGVHVIRKLAQKSGAKAPNLLTSCKFRKHIATMLQLMTLEDNEMEQIATFMGHTKKTHEEFYRLPQDIYQTAKVAKILLMLEKGKGKEFKGKKLSEIELGSDIYCSSESEDETNDDDKIIDIVSNICVNKNQLQTQYKKRNNKTTTQEKGVVEDEISEEHNQLMAPNDIAVKGPVPAAKRSKMDMEEDTGKKTGRRAWTSDEKKLVLDHFKEHIIHKIAPKKGECEEFRKMHKDILSNKDWVRIKTFVYNTYRNIR